MHGKKVGNFHPMLFQDSGGWTAFLLSDVARLSKPQYGQKYYQAIAPWGGEAVLGSFVPGEETPCYTHFFSVSPRCYASPLLLLQHRAASKPSFATSLSAQKVVISPSSLGIVDDRGLMLSYLLLRRPRPTLARSSCRPFYPGNIP